jgi:hypothetical protein
MCIFTEMSRVQITDGFLKSVAQSVLKLSWLVAQTRYKAYCEFAVFRFG